MQNPTLRDERGEYLTESLEGLALLLANEVAMRVDLEGEPVSLDKIRELARFRNTQYWEYHYLEHSQWFIKMTFADGTDITWGDDEE